VTVLVTENGHITLGRMRARTDRSIAHLLLDGTSHVLTVADVEDLETIAHHMLLLMRTRRHTDGTAIGSELTGRPT